MADRGEFNTSAYSGVYVKFHWWIHAQDIGRNVTTIGYQLVGNGNPNGYYTNAGPFSTNINGSSTEQGGRIQLYNGTVAKSGYTDIAHNNDGTKTFDASASAAIYSKAYNTFGSGSWSLNTIPRTANINSYDNVGRGAKKIDMRFSVDANLREIYYAINNVQWLPAGATYSNGYWYYTIKNLNPNTTYYISTRVIRNDSGLATETSGMQVSTYDIAKFGRDDVYFRAGENVNIRIYNPSGIRKDLEVFNGGELIASRNSISDNYDIAFSEAENLQIFRMLKSLNLKDMNFKLKTIEDGAEAGQDNKSVRCFFPKNRKLRVDGRYKKAIKWIKVGTTWYQTLTYVKNKNVYKKARED